MRNIYLLILIVNQFLPAQGLQVPTPKGKGQAASLSSSGDEGACVGKEAKDPSDKSGDGEQADHAGGAASSVSVALLQLPVDPVSKSKNIAAARKSIAEAVTG